jgi:hypothetical protein
VAGEEFALNASCRAAEANPGRRRLTPQSVKAMTTSIRLAVETGNEKRGR